MYSVCACVLAKEGGTNVKKLSLTSTCRVMKRTVFFYIKHSLSSTEFYLLHEICIVLQRLNV